ncbi:MAG: hypothetical protein HDQ91_06035 [Desulfovibrio sp.]|nr:hypothetical protein [Desulfovibrio sp.]
MARILTLLVLASLLAGCHFAHPRHLAVEEQDYYMVKEQCAQQATWLNPEWPGTANPAWNADFVSCLNGYGISDAALYRLWD